MRQMYVIPSDKNKKRFADIFKVPLDCISLYTLLNITFQLPYTLQQVS